MNNLYSNEQLTKLYEKTYSSVYAVVYSIVKNEQDACDLTQDTYISAFTNLEKLNNINKFDKWVIQIAANKCKDFLRKKKPTLFSQFGEDDENFEEDIPDNSETYNPDTVIEDKEKREIIKDILYSLPEDQRLCLVLYYGQELKISEIATALGVSENTVKSRLSYGKKKMKEQVDELEKKGTKLHGITAIGILPLIKQLFASQSFASPPASAISAGEIISNITKTTSAAKKVAGASKVVAKATSIVTKNIATKIASSVLAATIATTATVAVIKSDIFSNNTNYNTVSEVSSNYENNSKPDDEIVDVVESDVENTSTSSEELTSSQESSETETTSSEVISSSEQTSSSETSSETTSSGAQICDGLHLIAGGIQDPSGKIMKVEVDENFHASYIEHCNICGDIPADDMEPHKMVGNKCEECDYSIYVNFLTYSIHESCEVCQDDCLFFTAALYVNEQQHKYFSMEHGKPTKEQSSPNEPFSPSDFTGVITESELQDHDFIEGSCPTCHKQS